MTVYQIRYDVLGRNMAVEYPTREQAETEYQDIIGYEGVIGRGIHPIEKPSGPFGLISE